MLNAGSGTALQGNSARASSNEPISEINQSLNNANVVASELAKACEVLRSRLQPVLRPQPPSGQGNGGAPTPREVKSSIAERIDENAQLNHGALMNLAALLSELAL